MTTIVGLALDSGVVSIGSKQLSPNRSQSVRNHSPDGFSWGYSGSGPSQLALAILLEYTDDEEFSLQHYFLFRDEVVQFLPKDYFELDETVVVNWIKDMANG